jgi:hypothetical protein
LILLLCSLKSVVVRRTNNLMLEVLLSFSGVLRGNLQSHNKYYT